MLQILRVEDGMVCFQEAIFSTLGLRNFYKTLRSRLLETIMESGFKVLTEELSLTREVRHARVLDKDREAGRTPQVEDPPG